jgi:tRNA 2-thiocytidine biosynthesis protein TtcA
MFTALHNVVPSHLMDATRHNFKDITTTGMPDADGDRVFDDEEFAPASLPNLQVLKI